MHAMRMHILVMLQPNICLSALNVTLLLLLSQKHFLSLIINGMHNNNDVIDEYIHINPAIENVMIQDAKKLPQVEQPTEFVRQAEIFLN